MNTIVIFCETAGSRGQESHLAKIRFTRRCRRRRPVCGSPWPCWPADWFSRPRPLHKTIPGRIRPAAATSRSRPPDYPDEELPNRRVAANDDTPPLHDSGPRAAPSNRRPINRPGGKKPSLRRSSPSSMTTRNPLSLDPWSAAGRRSTRTPVCEPDEPFGNSGRRQRERFRLPGPDLRGVLANRLWFRGEALLWWARGGQTPPLADDQPRLPRLRPRRACSGSPTPRSSSATRN